MFSVSGAFKLDLLQPIEPILLQKISKFFTSILGGQFLLPQRADNGKRKMDVSDGDAKSWFMVNTKNYRVK